MLNNIRVFENIFLFLDYDGTLSGLRRDPKKARPSKRIKKIISLLADDPSIVVTVVSGRRIDELLDFFSDFNTSSINWSGIHGLEMKFGSNGIIRPYKTGTVLPKIGKIKKELFNIVNQYPCYRFEDKELSLALHYRKCSKNAIFLLDRIKDIIKKYEQDRSVEIMYMKKVIEIKPAGINKGNAIKAVISRSERNINHSINICVGDDITDEYLFRANPDGINLKVGKTAGGKVASEYFLNGVGDVHWFLNKISRLYRK